MSDTATGVLRVLIIGPMPPAVPTAANPVGGVSVNFEEMVRQLQQRCCVLHVVDLSRPRINLPRWHIWSNKVATIVRVIYRVCVLARHNHVVFLNVTAGSFLMLGSCIWMICTAGRRPLALRVFGGDFADRYDRYGRLMRWWANRTYMRCALVFVQTQEIVRRLSGYANVRWFPNTRNLQQPPVAHRAVVRKFLFVSQLRMDKGLGEALEACRDLPENCHLSVFGPHMPDTDFSLFDNHQRATYRGVLSPDEVPNVIAQHDVLILPTYFNVEGYPGIILEALQCGIPVISTWWKSVPEVVEHEKSGLLVAPRSTTALKDAIAKLMTDPELYQRLCRGARARGEFFRSTAWYDGMEADLRRLTGSRSSGPDS